MSSAPDFDNNLSCVFLEATLRSTYAGLGEKLPQEVWQQVLRESKARPAFTAEKCLRSVLISPLCAM